VKDLSKLSDEVVLKEASAGNKDAFGILYARYVGKIFNYVYYRTGNIHDAEDLTERVFFRAMKHICNYKDRGLPISAWLYRIAHNLVANWHRDNSRKKEILLDDGFFNNEQWEHLETSVVRSEESEQLLKIVYKLPEDRQQLLILKFVERLSNAEIGRIMGRTEGAIKSLYHRTLISLRDEYHLNIS